MIGWITYVMYIYIYTRIMYIGVIPALGLYNHWLDLLIVDYINYGSIIGIYNPLTIIITHLLIVVITHHNP